jgi:hypothetical protein
MAAPAPQPVITSPKSLSHIQVVIHRLRQRIDQLVTTTLGGAGLTQEGTATAALAVGEVVYADGAGSFDLAQADAMATSKWVGVVTTAALITATATIQTSGVVTNAGWALTTDNIYYLDPAVAGGITATGPTTVGQIVVPVGIAVSATELRLLSTPPILL